VESPVPKRLKQDSTEPILPVVVVDSPENRIRVVHSLIARAEAVARNNLPVAEAPVKQIG
jgi:DELLA protein